LHFVAGTDECSRRPTDQQSTRLCQQLPAGSWFQEHGIRTGRAHAHRAGRPYIAGEDEDGHFCGGKVATQNLAQGITVEQGKSEIGEHERRRPGQRVDERLTAVCGFDDICAPAQEQFAIDRASVGVVLRDEDARGREWIACTCGVAATTDGHT